MISTAARASAAHIHPDNPDDELVGATAAVVTGTVVGPVVGAVVAGAGDTGDEADEADAAGVAGAVATDGICPDEAVSDGAAGAGAPVNWNFTSPTTGWPSAETTR